MLAQITKNLFNFSKICRTPQQAIEGIKNGSFLTVGGFGICGIPMNLIQAVKQSGVKDLTIASNNCGYGDKSGSKDWGLGVILRNKQIKRMISSYVGENVQFQRQYLSGELELQICPQGTLAQKIRCGGAGVPAFYTATGVGTIVQKGGFPIKFKQGTNQPQILAKAKQVHQFNGKNYVLQQSLFSDFALIKAQKADQFGNLIFNKTARNFNADMCTASKCVIAEVQEIISVGSINPDHVHIPAVYVDRIFKSDPKCKWSDKRIQKLTLKQQQTSQFLNSDDIRLKIMRRAAKQVKSGMNVNLGIGIPTLLPSVLPDDIQINLQSQNGIFGVGPYPKSGLENPDLINAGKETVTVNPGGSYFSSSQSFGIIRGGHLDLTMLGALQISKFGDIANWIIPGKMVKGMGGAMDLVACGSKVIVVMQHMAKKTKKLLNECTLPLTAKGVVNMVITQLAVFQNRQGELVLIQIAQNTTIEKVEDCTDFQFKRADNLGRF